MFLPLRAARLLRTNPRLFLVRLAILLRHPLLYIRNGVGSSSRRALTQASYNAWIEAEARAAIFPEAAADGPLLSVLMPVYNVEGALLDEAIASVIRQTYGHWELCIVDDASTAPHIRPALEAWAARDKRIRVEYRHTSGHISAASNTALHMAQGEFVVLLDHDDCLSADALARVALAAGDPDVDFIYSDEDKLDTEGRRVQPFFKPAWSPTLLTSCNYITHLAALRRSLVLTVGGFREDMVGSQDHDLFLRAAERARAVAHIPHVLYSWRMAPQSTARASTAKPYAIDAARRALQDALARRRVAGEVRPTQLNGIFTVRRTVPERSRIALLVSGEGDRWESAIPSRGMEVCDVLRVGETGSGWHTSVPLHRLSSTAWDYVLLLDAASRPRGGDVLSALIEPLSDEGTGLAGGRTLLGKDRVLQAGVVIGRGGQPYHAYGGLYTVPYPDFYLNLSALPREVSAASYLCCAVRRDVWECLGGMDGRFPLALAVVDLCLRAAAYAYTMVYMPAATFSRREALPPLPRVSGLDWPWRDYDDPFWNPNLTAESGDGLPFRAAPSRPARIRRIPGGSDS